MPPSEVGKNVKLCLVLKAFKRLLIIPKVAEDLLSELNYLPEEETNRLIEILVERYLSKEESAKLAKMLINKLAESSKNESIPARVFMLTDNKN